MSRSHHPTKAQEYLTTFHKMVTHPTKSALNSDLVKKSIIEPTKKLLEQPLVKELITIPLINASSGRAISEIKGFAGGVKSDLKFITKPLFPPGLTEADVRDSGGDGYVKFYRDIDREGVVVETDVQRGITKPWEGDTWEDDEDSVFKSCSKLPSRSNSVIQFQDRNGQVQMMTLDDITDDLLSPEQMEEDVLFRPTELVELMDEEKALSLNVQMNNDIHFRPRDMEFNINQIEGAAEGPRMGFQYLLPEQPRRDSRNYGNEIPPGGLRYGSGRSGQRERVYTSDHAWNRHRRQTSRGRCSESGNRRYIEDLMTRPLPSDRRGTESRQSNMSSFEMQGSSDEDAAEYEEHEFGAKHLAADDEESIEDEEYLGNYFGSEDEEQIEDNTGSQDDDQEKKEEGHQERQEGEVTLESSHDTLFASAQDFLEASEYKEKRPNTKETPDPQHSLGRSKKPHGQKKKVAAASRARSVSRGRTMTRYPRR